jgi:hypothetical protein
MLNTTELNRFGIEIETVGATKIELGRAIATAVNGTVVTGGYGHSSETVVVRMADGREWKIVPDGSLSGGNRNGEIVSPILTYADMDMLQNVVRAARAAGAKADSSCGIHVHVDGSRFDVRGLVNLVNMVHKNERLIERALGVSDYRLSHYTRALRPDFIQRLEQRRPRTMEDLQTAWYANADAYPSRYNGTRYHGLNLNSFFYRKTVEFRYFNGTMHAGEVKSYVQLCLALVQRAQTCKATSRARREVAAVDQKWAFRLFLKTLGMLGEEFKTARLHLSKNLPGNGSNPKRSGSRPAVAAVEAPIAAE